MTGLFHFMIAARESVIVRMEKGTMAKVIEIAERIYPQVRWHRRADDVSIGSAPNDNGGMVSLTIVLLEPLVYYDNDDADADGKDADDNYPPY